MIGRVSAAASFIGMAAIPAGQASGAAAYAAAGPHLAFAVFTAAVLAGALLLTTSPAVRHLCAAAAPTGGSFEQADTSARSAAT